MSDGTKYCPACLTTKPLTEFSPKYKARPDGPRQAVCKPCNSLRRRQYQYNPQAQEAFYARHGGQSAYQKQRYATRKARGQAA